MPALQAGKDFALTNLPKKLHVPRGVLEEDCQRTLVSLKPGAPERLLAAYKSALTFAVKKYEAHVVCVSELGLPQQAIRPLAAAQDFTRDLSAAHDVLIIGGTSHDRRTLYNTGYLYHPNDDNDWTFHKSISATGMGERIASPSLRRVLTVKTLGLRIAVMICLDVADYATLASVIRVRDKVDMVLVPCYTFKFDKMLEVAKTASKALRGIVAMVNARIPNSYCHIARFGEDEEPVRHQMLNSGAVVSLFNINYKQFERERDQQQREGDYEDVDWLFGNYDVPQVLPKPRVRQRTRRP